MLGLKPKTILEHVFGDSDVIDAQCYEVYDGDTCKVVMNLPSAKIKATVRWFGIDTPEIRSRKKSKVEKDTEKVMALKARDHVRAQILNQNCKLRIDRNGTDKYGRLLGIFYPSDAKIPERKGSDVFTNSLNEYLVSNGLAVNKFGSAKDFV